MSHEWISTKQRLPKEWVKVLAYSEVLDEYKVDYVIYSPDPFWACRKDGPVTQVDYWMELPKIPRKTDE